MNFDDFFIAIIIVGIGLSVACLCAKYREWRKFQDVERRKAARFREMHARQMRTSLTRGGMPRDSF
jgi:hypothetical protein